MRCDNFGGLWKSRATREFYFYKSHSIRLNRLELRKQNENVLQYFDFYRNDYSESSGAVRYGMVRYGTLTLSLISLSNCWNALPNAFESSTLILRR